MPQSLTFSLEIKKRTYLIINQLGSFSVIIKSNLFAYHFAN